MRRNLALIAEESDTNFSPPKQISINLMYEEKHKFYQVSEQQSTNVSRWGIDLIA